jgi:hypothetical protein
MLYDDPNYKVLVNSRIILAAMTWFPSLCLTPFCLTRGNRFDSPFQIQVLRHQSKERTVLLVNTQGTIHELRCGLCPSSGSRSERAQGSLQHDEVVSIEDLVLGLLWEFPRVPPFLTHGKDTPPESRDTVVGRLGRSDR